MSFPSSDHFSESVCDKCKIKLTCQKCDSNSTEEYESKQKYKINIEEAKVKIDRCGLRIKEYQRHIFDWLKHIKNTLKFSNPWVKEIYNPEFKYFNQ